MEPQPAEAERAKEQMETYLDPIQALLKEVIHLSGFDLTFTIQKSQPSGEDLETPDYIVEFSGPDADLLVEKGATLLNALEYLVLKAVRLEEELFGKITFDCKDWRRLRARELQ